MLILSGCPPWILISVCSNTHESSMGGVFFFLLSFFPSLRLHKEDQALIIMFPCQLSDHWLSWEKKKSLLSSKWMCVVFALCECWLCLKCKQHTVRVSFLDFLCFVINPYKPNSAHSHSLPTVQQRSCVAFGKWVGEATPAKRTANINLGYRR